MSLISSQPREVFATRRCEGVKLVSHAWATKLYPLVIWEAGLILFLSCANTDVATLLFTYSTCLPDQKSVIPAWVDNFHGWLRAGGRPRTDARRRYWTRSALLHHHPSITHELPCYSYLKWPQQVLEMMRMGVQLSPSVAQLHGCLGRTSGTTRGTRRSFPECSHTDAPRLCTVLPD